MTISLLPITQLMTNYVGVHGANYAAIESAINALQTQVAGSLGTLISGGNSSEAMFGIQNALINEGSYLPTADGTDLDVAAGYFWHFASFTVRRKLTASTIAFAGDSAATYYIVVDATGEPTKSASSTGAAYSVVWTGSAFGTITRLVPIAWGHDTFNAAKDSTELAEVYQSLDARLEAGEAESGAALAAHVAAADPHVGYQREAEKSAANGYASLDSGGKVPAAELPSSGPGSGTVTSVALTVPAELSVAGSPITTSGTLAVTKVNQSANQVYAGPASGGAAAPAFRALVAGDIPAQPYIIAGFYPGVPGVSQIIVVHVFTDTVTFPSGLGNSKALAQTAATGSTVFDIAKWNGSSWSNVGTATFGAAGTTATFAMASGQTFSAGDAMKITGPLTPDSTIADVTFSIRGTR